MTYIIYDVATGTVLSTSQTQPVQPTPDKAIAQVSFQFLSGQRVCMFRYDGSNVVENLEANIQLFAPLIVSEIVAINTMLFSQIIQNPLLNQTVYCKQLDISFFYNGVQWEQCGENTILQEGLISGVLFANDVQIG